MTSNTQFTASGITEEDYNVGEYIIYNDKPYKISKFKNNKAILIDASEVKTNEFNEEGYEVGELVYLDKVPYTIKEFSSGKAVLEYTKINMVNIDDENRVLPTANSYEYEETTEYINEIGPIVNENYSYNSKIYANGPMQESTSSIDNTIKTNIETANTTVNINETSQIIEQEVLKETIKESEKETESISEIETTEIIEKEIKSAIEEEKIDIVKATDSLISTKSTLKKNYVNIQNATMSIPKKGEVDIYGNVINYDIEDWVGEDVENNNDQMKDIVSKVMTASLSNEYKNGFGKIEISIEDLTTFKKSNIDLTILDDEYNLHIVHLFYRNNYKEKLDILPGHYRVYQIKYSNSLKKDEVYTNIDEFTIDENKTTQLKIYHSEEKLNELKNEGLIIKEHEKTNVNYIFNGALFKIIGSGLIVVLVIVGILIFLRKRKDN